MDKRPLVVWCDDNPDIRALAAIAARNYGWDIFTTSHAVGVLAEYKRSCPDAIVLDLILPTFSTDVESGLDACAEIRKIDSKIPIIIFTGMDTAIAKPAGFASGANWTFIKTEASLEDIFNKIEELRGNRRESQRTLKAPGQNGGSWFSNREMAVYAINALFILALAWYLGRIEYAVVQLQQQISTEQAFRVADDGKIMRIQGQVDALKGK